MLLEHIQSDSILETLAIGPRVKAGIPDADSLLRVLRDQSGRYDHAGFHIRTQASVPRKTPRTLQLADARVRALGKYRVVLGDDLLARKTARLPALVLMAIFSDTMEIISTRYHEDGSAVWAEYSGGRIARGSMVGVRLSADTLDLRYQHVGVDGKIKTGICRSTLSLDGQGKLTVAESWKWTCEDHSHGESVLIEVTRA